MGNVWGIFYNSDADRWGTPGNYIEREQNSNKKCYNVKDAKGLWMDECEIWKDDVSILMFNKVW